MLKFKKIKKFIESIPLIIDYIIKVWEVIEGIYTKENMEELKRIKEEKQLKEEKEV